MTYWIVGAGGIGCAIGGRLAASDDVVFVDGWREHVDAIAAHGLRVDYPEETVTAIAPVVHMSEMGRIGHVPDVVLLAVKAYDTRDVCVLLAPVIGHETLVVSLQNCLNEETIAEVLGARRTVGAIVLVDGELVGPGHSRQARPSGRLVIGPWGEDAGRLERLAKDLGAKTGLSVEVSDEIRRDLWSKLARNSMVNAISAVGSVGVGELFADAGYRRLSLALGAEAARIAQAAGIELLPDEFYGHPQSTLLTPAGSPEREDLGERFRRAYEPYQKLPASMLQDIAKGRRTEIDYMNGFFVEQGKQLGVPTPLNESICQAVREVEAGQLTQGRQALEAELVSVSS